MGFIEMKGGGAEARNQKIRFQTSFTVIDDVTLRKGRKVL
jgi:hypothetical protein